MPTVTVYRHGSTCGNGNPNAKPPQHTAGKGWTTDSNRWNQLFLYSVDDTKLTGCGQSFTLTVKTCPPTGADWAAMRNALLHRARRAGLIRAHWLTEMQGRGVPHTHGSAWFPEGVSFNVCRAWLEISEAYGSTPLAQHSAPIFDVTGWNQYVSKHAARGIYHYQRNPENMPAGWKGVSAGRMWGRVGDWPIQPPMRVDLNPKGYHAYRRIIRAWRIAQARVPGPDIPVCDANGRKVAVLAGLPSGASIRRARGLLRCPLEKLSAVRGCSEWFGEALNLRVLAHLAARGFELLSV